MATCMAERTTAGLLMFNVALRGVIIAPDGKQGDIEAHLDRIMEGLLELRAQDPGIEATLSDGSVFIHVMVGAPNPLDAINQASGFIRSAVHAAGGATPDWPDAHHGAWSMQLLGVSADPANEGCKVI